MEFLKEAGKKNSGKSSLTSYKALGLTAAGCPGSERPLLRLPVVYKQECEDYKKICEKGVDFGDNKEFLDRDKFVSFRASNHPKCIDNVLEIFKNSWKEPNYPLRISEVSNKDSRRREYYSTQHQINMRYNSNTEWGRKTHEMVQADQSSHYYISENVL